MRRLLAVLCLVTITTAAADEAHVRREMIQFVDAHMAEAEALLERSVNINSGTMNFSGIRAVAELLEPEFVSLGFEVSWYDGADFERAGHLLAMRDGKAAAPKVLLIGHLDTVFEPDSPFQAYERLDATHAKGPGTTDMKGGNLVMLYALRALDAAGVLDDLSVRVVLTGDEERRGHPLDLATRPLIDAAVWADVAIGFEDGDSDPKTAVTARRGASGWSLVVTGKPAHSSQVFRDDIGYGAIYELARILDQFRTALEGEPNLTFNPGLIVGGTEAELDQGTARGSAFGKTNVIAEIARAEGDIRAVSPEQLAMARERMEAIVGENLAHTEARIEFEDGYPPMAPTPGNQRLLALYDQVSRDLGFGPVQAVDPRRAGAADISFAANHVEMALDGIGLMGSGGHTLDEVADLETFPMQIKRAALLLYRLAHPASE
ncbi:MAG: M20/M25/M40 family metallo-hydrolase [Xanthomonadales bacterium]|nr:M20/M25/M40 family metallo-hydrolase [Xanthomonadales bacterium]